MEKSPNALAGSLRRVRAAHAEFVEMGIARVNLMLTGPPTSIGYLLDELVPDLREPIGRWCPGEPLLLPPVGSIQTLVVRDVGTLPVADQRRLFEWLHGASGTTQIVSTTSASLLPLVKSGAFIEALYYRLNIVMIDLAAAHAQPPPNEYVVA